MTRNGVSDVIREIRHENRSKDMHDLSTMAFKNNISLLNISQMQPNKNDESQLLSKSMQADLKTLNLKRTFSFLQNLDYNDDEGKEVIREHDVSQINEAFSAYLMAAENGRMDD